MISKVYKWMKKNIKRKNLKNAKMDIERAEEVLKDWKNKNKYKK